MFQHITENYRRLLDGIEEVCAKAGRNPSEIRLMAVTKTVPPEAINHAISLGIDLIGENRVQELCGKLPHLNLDGVEIHLIGHLQSNKVRQVVGLVQCIQSVDSVKIAVEISKRSVGMQSVLLELNIGDQDSKFGFSAENIQEAAKEIALLPNLSIDGLMTIPPYSRDSRENLENFWAAKRIFEEIRQKIPTMKILSMGMSSDFKEAIAAGSTLIRVGSSLFGERVY